MPGRVSWGVIGSGGIALRRTIPEGIVPASNAVLRAVHDINPTANADAARRFGAQAVASIDELLASGIDAVYIATPAAAHREQVLACVRAGKHVLCEKPLGMNVAEAEEMLAACRSAGVEIGTAFMMRFLAQHQAALKLIEDGRLGKPVYARAQLSCWYPPIEGAWRQDPARGGGGSLIDMGGHCIDLLEMFFGPVAKVSCFINNTVHGYRSEDSAVAMLSFANGAIGTVDTFFCIPDEASDNVLELYGSLGCILAKGTIGQGSQGTMAARLKQAEGAYDAQQQRDAAGGVEIAPEPVNTYLAEIEDFSQALREGRSTRASAEAGLRSQQVLAACYESARTGRAIPVP
ncbi:MAG: Gfo/Idh/MocA family oxidoreductase [Acidobacteriota bacterium]